MERRHGTFDVLATARLVAVGIVFLSAILSGAATVILPTRPGSSGVSVRSVRLGDHADLVVENHRLHDITLSLSIDANNVTILRLAPETATYPPQSSRVAARLSMTDAAKGWRLRYRFDWTKGDMHAQHDDRTVYRLPFEPGTSHRIIQGYNDSTSHMGVDQYAVDFAMPEGTVVCAARDGLVVDLRQSSKDGGVSEADKRRSNYVSVLHDDGTIAEYLHLQQEGVLVDIGQHVAAGTPIALSGNTGYSSRPHLHFGVYSPVDGTHIQSHPVTFASRQGTVTEPVRGRLYTAK